MHNLNYHGRALFHHFCSKYFGYCWCLFAYQGNFVIHKSLYQLIGIGLRNAQNFAAPYVNFFKPKFALGIAVIKIASLCGKIKFAKIFCLIQLKLNFRLNVKILHPVLSCSERLFAGFKKCAKTYVPSNSILSTCLLCLTSDGGSLVQKMAS